MDATACWDQGRALRPGRDLAHDHLGVGCPIQPVDDEAAARGDDRGLLEQGQHPRQALLDRRRRRVQACCQRPHPIDQQRLGVDARTLAPVRVPERVIGGGSPRQLRAQVTGPRLTDQAPDTGLGVEDEAGLGVVSASVHLADGGAVEEAAGVDAGATPDDLRADRGLARATADPHVTLSGGGRIGLDLTALERAQARAQVRVREQATGSGLAHDHVAVDALCPDNSGVHLAQHTHHPRRRRRRRAHDPSCHLSPFISIMG